MTTRALRQKSSSSSISGASGRVRVSPRSCMALSSAREYCRISSFSIFAYLPCTNDPAIVAAPCIHHNVIIVVHVSQGAYAHLAVVGARVLGFDHGICKDQGGIGKIHPVLCKVLTPFLFTPFK